jgi:hypothetical protein
MGALNALPHEVKQRGRAITLYHSEVLFMAAMPVTSVYLVSRGAILVFSEDGTTLKRWVGPQQIIGIHDALIGGTWQGVGVAHGITEVIGFGLGNLHAAIEKIPQGHRALLQDLMAR